MKKLIIGGLLALVLMTPVASQAQTVTQEEVNAQLLSLINSLMVQVQELMQQLIAMQAKQVEQGQTLTTIQTQTAPVVGAVSQPAQPSISFGTPYCDPGNPEKTTAYLPITVSGVSWKYGSATINTSDGWKSIGFFNTMQSPEWHRVTVRNNEGQVTITVNLGNRLKMLSNEPEPAYTTTHTAIVGDVCQ